MLCSLPATSHPKTPWGVRCSVASLSMGEFNIDHPTNNWCENGSARHSPTMDQSSETDMMIKINISHTAMTILTNHGQDIMSTGHMP